MIVSIGMADRNSVAYKFADELAAINAPVSFLGPFSQSEESLDLLNYTIDRCILFDPVMCNTSGRAEDITSDRLISAFTVNSDIEFVCVDQEVFCFDFVREAVQNALNTVNAKLVVLNKTDDLKKLAKELSSQDKYEK